MVNDVFTKQLGEDVFLDGDEFIGLPEQVGLLLAQPHQLGNGGHGMNRRSRAQVQFMSAQLIFQAGSRGAAPVVGPGNTGGQRLACRVDSNHTMHR
ncbi:hypothetical protein D3C73_1269000 [compost metagenome]